GDTRRGRLETIAHGRVLEVLLPDARVRAEDLELHALHAVRVVEADAVVARERGCRIERDEEAEAVVACEGRAAVQGDDASEEARHATRRRVRRERGRVDDGIA